MKKKETIMKKEKTIRELIKDIDSLPQRQDSLSDQLIDLVIITDRFGMWDASDFLRTKFNSLERKKRKTMRPFEECPSCNLWNGKHCINHTEYKRCEWIRENRPFSLEKKDNQND